MHHFFLHPFIELIYPLLQNEALNSCQSVISSKNMETLLYLLTGAVGTSSSFILDRIFCLLHSPPPEVTINYMGSPIDHNVPVGILLVPWDIALRSSQTGVAVQHDGSKKLYQPKGQQATKTRQIIWANTKIPPRYLPQSNYKME